MASSTTNDKEIVRNTLAPGGLRWGGPDLFVAPPRRSHDIDSSLRLDLKTVAAATNATLFMGQNTGQ